MTAGAFESGDVSSNPTRIRDSGLQEMLINHCSLTPEAVARIIEVTRAGSMTFPQAALHLGFITSDDVRSATELLRKLDSERTASPIQVAIRKLSSGGRHEIVVREGAPVKPGKRLSIAHEPHTEHSEKLRALRTELLLIGESTRDAKVLTVVSPCAGEGRSQLSAELAIAFAQLGRRTLLVDADMRRPSLHLYFDTDNKDGLTQALQSGDRPITHPVVGLPHLSLLTAGTVPPNPLELLSDGRFQRLVNDWRRNCEFVVIDTPPISQCADGLAVATIAGRALVLSRAKHTPYAAAKEMLRRLESTQAAVLGAVINHF